MVRTLRKAKTRTNLTEAQASGRKRKADKQKERRRSAKTKRAFKTSKKLGYPFLVSPSPRINQILSVVDFLKKKGFRATSCEFDSTLAIRVGGFIKEVEKPQNQARTQKFLDTRYGKGKFVVFTGQQLFDSKIGPKNIAKFALFVFTKKTTPKI